jgi:hypothetical protein
MSTIKTILLDEDIEGLIKIGAPADEYNSEAVQIGSEIYKLQGQPTEKQVTRVIEDMWQRSFGPMGREEIKLRRDAFRHVAQRIILETTATRKPSRRS